MVRRRKLRTLVALAAILEQWTFHDNVEVIWTPRYLIEVCQSSWEPLITYIIKFWGYTFIRNTQ